MEISEDELDYINHVKDRCYKLIDMGVWEGVKKERLDGWIGCLNNCDAKLLAAYLLDNLTYRSREQYASLLDFVFQDLMVSTPEDTHQVRLLDELTLRKTKASKFAIQIAPVIGLSAPPTKSGPYILRLAQRRYRIQNDWLSWPNRLVSADKITHLYLIDDFCGTGEQFSHFLSSIQLNEIREKSPEIKIYYLVTTIHAAGKKLIADKYPFVEVICAEQLSDANSILSDTALKRYQIQGFAEKIKNQYAAAIEYTDLPVSGKLAVGFGGLGLSYGFTHATPNNTLPIFWMETPKLTPLLDR